MTDVFDVLRAAVDGGRPVLEREHATAVFARLAELGSEIGTLKSKLTAAERRASIAEKRNEAMSSEASGLVAQVVSEEARAFAAESKLDRATAVLRSFVDDGNNLPSQRQTVRHRERAARLLKEIG